jgi:LysM repeat protein
VTIGDATGGATIYYTTNGTTPTTSSTVYSGPITVSATETIEAIAVESGYANSPVATAAYTIAAGLPAPTFSPAAGTYTTSQTVTIGDSTAGATIYYTTNGTTPTTSSTVYTGPITVSVTETLEAIAVEAGYANSPVATAAYTIAAGLPAPAFSPAAGTYTSPQSVTISDAQAGATIYYTTNGTTPTTSSTVYAGAIWQSSTQTLKAIAVESGYANSAVTTATYTIAPVLPAPAFSPAGGGASWALFTSPPSVTISDSQAGATFYYTTNGTTPTTSSTLYTGPITVSVTETIEAIAVETGYSNSPMSSMLYSIAPMLPAPTFSLAAGTYSTSQSVTIGDSTAGTTIYYTTNGTTPTTSSTKYTGAITVSATETLEAIAVESGYCNSPAATSAYTITATALPAPTFSLAPGTYTTSQTVTISDSTAGTTIYYTTNGTTPTTSSTVYSGAITVSATETIKAIAIETGYTNSAVASGAYTIAPVLPAPTFSPAAGTYTTSQSVTISDATAGTTIYYTTNGTTPTTSSTVYSGPITVSATETLEAIAVETGYTNSAVASAAYIIAPVLPAPTFSPTPGTYTTSQTVIISDTTAGTTIYYTTNGTTPTTSSSMYTGAITVSATETIKAIAVESGYCNSPAATAAYTIAPVLPTPIFSLAPGTYTTSQTVTISDTTAGTTIYYTTNGATPTTSSSVYSGAITISSTETLAAIAVETGYTNSAVATAVYTIAPVLPAPTFSPAAGTYTTSQSVTISDATAGTIIYYTTNGTTPTTSSTVYSGPITVSATETLEAIAVEAGYTNSAVASAAYTVAPVLPAPTFSPTPGTYTTSQTVIISDSTAGTTIYYTTNGTTPTTSSTVYSGAIAVSATETLKAIAVESGYCNSPPATAAYTIAPVLPTPTFSLAPGTYTTSQAVTISDATAGTTIYYTTNGTTPTTSSSVYSSTITVSATETLEAIAVETSYTNSAVASAAYTIAPVLPAPTFSLAAGTYTTSQTVTISDTTAGTTIYYTTNGTTPTTSSTVYSGPITVSATEMLEAIAVETDYTNSAVASAAYTIAPVLPAPTFSPAPGTYTTSQTVTISDATAGTTIYYTTNGTTPTTSSTKYTGAITVSATETLEAIAVEAGCTNSPAASAAYIITAETSYINYPSDGFTASSLSLNNGPTVTGGVLQVTDGGTTEMRSAWSTTKVPVSGFTTDFTFQMLNAVADGFTFTIQNDPKGMWALGNGGSGLGYQGIQNSVALKFDIYNDAGEGTDSIGVYTDGAAPTMPATDLSSSGVTLLSGDLMHAHLVYSGTTLTVTLTDTKTGSSVTNQFTVNIPSVVGGNTAYVGFTGSTGAFTAVQQVTSWTYLVP